MLKASALYIVIVIALVISVLCSAFIVAGYYYRSAYQQNLRYGHLRNDLRSGINMLLSGAGQYHQDKRLLLFGEDSLVLSQRSWGLFDAATVRSFIQQDTLSKAFLMADGIDSSRWAAVYLIDEDRSASVSGNTHIRGTVFLPKAGIKEAYVNDQAYTGDKQLVTGAKKTSEKTLPALLSARVAALQGQWSAHDQKDIRHLPADTVRASFLGTPRKYYFKMAPVTLSKVHLRGNLVLFSDTTVTIDSTAYLADVLIFAKNIVVKSGFTGNAQLFAQDSIHLEKRCTLQYPSCVGVFHAGEKDRTIRTITIDDGSVISGAVFIYEQHPGKLPPMIGLGKAVTIFGQVYVPGMLGLKDHAQLYGSVFTDRFIYQAAYTRYENYLINADIDALKLSRYYLSSDLFPVAGKNRKVLQWLQ